MSAVCHTCKRELAAGESAWAGDWIVFESSGPRATVRYTCDDCHDGPRGEPVYGFCTACRSVEVRLNEATGTRDLSSMGESADYPTGYGCELCA